jgi:hypothetical protein
MFLDKNINIYNIRSISIDTPQYTSSWYVYNTYKIKCNKILGKNFEKTKNQMVPEISNKITILVSKLSVCM